MLALILDGDDNRRESGSTREHSDRDVCEQSIASDKMDHSLLTHSLTRSNNFCIVSWSYLATCPLIKPLVHHPETYIALNPN